MISASLQSLPEQTFLQISISRSFEYIMLCAYTSHPHRSVYPRALLLFASLCFSFLSSLRSFRSTFRSTLNLFPLTQNALLHETLSSILPHSCSRRRPASTCRERLVRSVHSRKMLLGCACRPYPSLTSHTYAHIVGPCQCDFGHYPCRWLANWEMQPD